MFRNLAMAVVMSLSFAAPSAAYAGGNLFIIASDGEGSIGFYHGADREEGRESALDSCGSGDCRIIKEKRAQCAAVAEGLEDGGYSIGTGFGPSAGKAKKSALKLCTNELIPDCEITVVECG